MKGYFPKEQFERLTTPFYFYDTRMLRRTIQLVKENSDKYGFHTHYAIKANANPRILTIICEAGLGADCVSGGEINAALAAGFHASKIVFAGVGKSDWEIELGLQKGIACFNVESVAELEVIQEIAARMNKQARVALRINPEVNANTHHYITTGLKENKFGIALSLLENVIEKMAHLPNIELKGLHFHIGSQITDLSAFQSLCVRINELQEQLEKQKVTLEHINVGGGLGVNYQEPNREPYCDFASYYAIFNKHLRLRPSQTVHFELGRAIVCQCGSLISRVLYVKEGVNKQFAIIDAGMTELIRPALYQASHAIENLSSAKTPKPYDVVGPICESSDCFGKAIDLNEVQRGNLIAVRSAGAYGEIMASQYNCRSLPKAYYSEDFGL